MRGSVWRILWLSQRYSSGGRLEAFRDSVFAGPEIVTSAVSGNVG
jgi:hypothetical protein